MDNEELLLKIEEGIGTITLNRPERKNAFTMTMIDKWAATLADWRTDPDVKVIVVTGAGDAFCSGVDFTASGRTQQDEGPYERKSVLWDRIHRIALTLEDIDKPVIAVPTSIGYGASFGGITALLGMLNSCASNVSVVNIDNGFGAGYVAATINALANSSQA